MTLAGHDLPPVSLASVNDAHAIAHGVNHAFLLALCLCGGLHLKALRTAISAFSGPAMAALPLATEVFDAVLKDIQQSLMVSCTVNPFIRQAHGLLDWPPLAETAFAQPQSIEMTRLAGRARHAVTPSNVEDFLDRPTTERQAVRTRSMARPDAAPIHLTAARQWTCLNIAAGLKMFNGDAETYLNLLYKFMQQHGDDIDAAQRQLSLHNPEAAIHLLHCLSGIASLLKAQELAGLASAAEDALTSNNAQVMPTLFEKLQAAMASVKASIHQFGFVHAQT